MKKELVNDIMKLEVKRKKIGLTKAEEKIYCRLNSKLTGYPEKVFTEKYGKKLILAIEKTDKLLVLLKNWKKNKKAIYKLLK